MYPVTCHASGWRCRPRTAPRRHALKASRFRWHLVAAPLPPGRDRPSGRERCHVDGRHGSEARPSEKSRLMSAGRTTLPTAMAAPMSTVPAKKNAATGVPSRRRTPAASRPIAAASVSPRSRSGGHPRRKRGARAEAGDGNRSEQPGHGARPVGVVADGVQPRSKRGDHPQIAGDEQHGEDHPAARPSARITDGDAARAAPLMSIVLTDRWRSRTARSGPGRPRGPAGLD